MSVGVVPVPAAATAAPVAAGGRFSSLRRGLRTEGEALGKARDIPRSPFWGAGRRRRPAHLAYSDWLKFSTSLLIGDWSSQISLGAW